MSLLVVFIATASLVAAGYGVISRGGPGRHEFTSLHGEVVTIYSVGLYRNDSVSAATQAISQDVVTPILGIPLLAGSMMAARKGSLKARLLLAGTLGCFLYTYASYSFLSVYTRRSCSTWPYSRQASRPSP